MKIAIYPGSKLTSHLDGARRGIQMLCAIALDRQDVAKKVLGQLNRAATSEA